MDADSGNTLAGARGTATRLPAHDLDLERARRFYSEKLGLEPVDERPDGLLHRSGNAEFALFRSAGASSGTFTQMGWQVDDVEGVVSELR
jgi:catechol 2,3-dioxygenase-like lactoylglutathione lyase family enzyme